MLYATLGNKVRQISQAEVEKFINLGYGISDDAGNLIYEAIPTDVHQLRTAFVTHKTEIAELTAQIAELTALLAEKEKAVEVVKEEPTTTRKKKTQE